MMGLLEVIFPEIQQHIRFLEMDITGLHYLRMLMPMLENVMLVKEVLEDKLKQQVL